ncbi:MAG: ferrous iron transport protein B [Candidatus Thermoplasmatota archaeon]|jgi:ferrous iron transport protein B|nr:ferrous iron transport protein B [Candidatus Thermoplasmatota archaeon]
MEKTDITIALAGNANVGKSVIFNQLTGLGQIIGNWPGKTVEKAEGILVHHDKRIKVIDLPGIYSLSTYSQEELISREYIALGHPDVVVNVVDATALERNLFFTLQLIEMQIPLVLAINLIDVAKKKGININYQLLSDILGVPVVQTVATKGIGVHEIADESLKIINQKTTVKKPRIRYGSEIEKRIEKIEETLRQTNIGYPLRWIAIKLLEEDLEIIKIVEKKAPDVVKLAQTFSREIEEIHKEPCATVIASERYATAAKIVKEIETHEQPQKPSWGERLDALSMHSIGGYVVLFLIMFAILSFISLFGGWLSEVLQNFFEQFRPQISGFWPELAWNGGVVGFYASLGVALGFILPFYIILGILEDSGYLPKVAYLMDRPCHTMGLHGKACMPLLVAFGCNVPACAGCRILETNRDRYIALILSTLIPCSARTVVILGLVGAYVGIGWAVALYIFDFILIFLIGRLLNKIIPGSSVGIIMEMPPYRTPSSRVIIKQAWVRFKPFVLTAVPLIILGSIIVEAMRLTNVLSAISDLLSPITVVWLGLPAFTGFLFIFGVLRKEAALVLLATAAGTTNISQVMSPLQMIIFALVIMIYIPCIATIAAIVKEAGWKRAISITFFEITLAILIGGIAFRILHLIM